MNTSGLIKDLFRHMEWADALAWSVVLDHSSLVEDASLRDRLYHLHLVQRAFLHIWRDEPLAFEGTQTLTGKGLAAWGRAYHGSVRPLIESLTESELDRDVHLPWAAHAVERLGTGVATPSMGETLVQVASHSTYHRGQINARIRELGQAPPLTDFIAWVWTGKPAPAWPRGIE